MALQSGVCQLTGGIGWRTPALVWPIISSCHQHLCRSTIDREHNKCRVSFPLGQKPRTHFAGFLAVRDGQITEPWRVGCGQIHHFETSAKSIQLESHRTFSCVCQLDGESPEDTSTWGDDGAVTWRKLRSLNDLVISHTPTKYITLDCFWVKYKLVWWRQEMWEFTTAAGTYPNRWGGPPATA